jgi:hypothetical protein
MSDIDFEWEFNAPHWFDFSGQEVGEPDAWFDEQAQKIASQKNATITASCDKPTADVPRRKPTRIPVPAAHRMNQPSNAVSQSAGSRLVRKDPRQTPAGKTPTRIPLSERRNRVE